MEQTSLLSQSVWLELPKPTRAKIAALFEFPEKGNIQTMYGPTGPVVISDGYGYDALKLITMERMQELTGSKSDNFYQLFKKIVMLVDEESVAPEEIVEGFDSLKELVDDTVTEIEIDEDSITRGTYPSLKKKFCEKCASKGGRHLKICPTLHENKTA